MPKLSPRELDCLKWAAAGKTVWETSIILGISQSTVRFFFENVRHKLDAANTTHAVAKALYSATNWMRALRQSR